jgi:inward rectifier potassium channel
MRRFWIRKSYEADDGIVRVGVASNLRSDLYHLLITSSWPELLLVLICLYLAANALFAFGYTLQDDAIENARPGSFVDAFFFSVQTMATIGYGGLLANVLVTIETLVGLLGLAMVTGIVFAKFSRPSARVLFSRVAVIGVWNGMPALMFRMANERGNDIAEAQIHLTLTRQERTLEGESIRRFHDLELVRRQNPIFRYTWTAIHLITPASPLYGATGESLAASAARVVVSLVGLEESYGQTVYARFDYRPDAVVWNARFVDLISDLPDGRSLFDFRLFHDVVTTTTPRPPAF